MVMGEKNLGKLRLVNYFFKMQIDVSGVLKTVNKNTVPHKTFYFSISAKSYENATEFKKSKL